MIVPRRPVDKRMVRHYSFSERIIEILLERGNIILLHSNKLILRFVTPMTWKTYSELHKSESVQ